MEFELFLKDKKIKDGCYKLSCGLGSLELVFDGFDGVEEVAHFLVVFSGAISDKEATSPPYFSGLRIAKEMGLPILSLSDPALHKNDDVALGWYAGTQEVINLPDKISEIIQKIKNEMCGHPILLGGSGGGFAALVQAHLLPFESSVLVWNPQTDIRKYSPSSVLSYLSSAFSDVFGECDQEINNIKEERKIDDLVRLADIYFSLLELPCSNLLKHKVVYLQNEADWHLKSHAIPYLGNFSWKRLSERTFLNDNDVLFHVGNWGRGHVAAPKMIIKEIVSQFIDGFSTECVGKKTLEDNSGNSFFHFFDVDDVHREIKPSYSFFEEDGFNLIKVNKLFDNNCLYESGVEYAIYIYSYGKKNVFWYQSSPLFRLPKDLKIDAVQIFLRDSWGGVRQSYYNFS